MLEKHSRSALMDVDLLNVDEESAGMMMFDPTCSSGLDQASVCLF